MSEKILLLEDDLSLINGLSFALKKHGFEPSIARTLPLPFMPLQNVSSSWRLPKPSMSCNF